MTFKPDMIFISAGFDAHKKDTINSGESCHVIVISAVIIMSGLWFCLLMIMLLCLTGSTNISVCSCSLYFLCVFHSAHTCNLLCYCLSLLLDLLLIVLFQFFNYPPYLLCCLPCHTFFTLLALPSSLSPLPP